MPPSTELRHSPAAQAAWTRLARGRNAFLLGERSPSDPATVPAAGSALIPLRIDCAHHRGELGFVRDVLAAISGSLGVYPSHWLPGELRSDPGLRRRLLEDAPTRYWGGALVAALRDLAERTRGRAVLVLQGIDEASDEVARILVELFERSDLLRLRVLMTSGVTEPESPAAVGLLETFLAREGEDGVFRVAETEPEAASEAREPVEAAPDADARTLPDEVLRVLRALAVANPDAEVEALSALLDLSPLRILEALQSARDLGVVVRDRGDGRFSLAPEIAETLTASLMPTLARAYHRRLADWHGAEGQAPEELEPRPTPEPPTPGSATEPATELPGETVAPEPAPPLAPEERRDPLRPVARIEEAASHAEAAGDLELAARQYARALQESMRMGLFEQALDYGRKALELIEGLPESESRRGLRIDVLATLALVHWQAAGTGPEVSLDGARSLLDRATSLLRKTDPASAAAELDALRAQILYDVGSSDALEHALAAVTRASRVWQGLGEPVRAAQLLNDEAAIWVRIGDPVRANHLLTKSLEVFGSLPPEDETGRLEAAETHHLLARLIFHADARPGREHDAVQVSIDHARAAEEIYAALDQPRERARVHETLGRLFQLLGDSEDAETWLRDAATAQQDHGDPLGLARTTAALAELFAERGDAAGCLELLGRSVELNAGTGSPLGLAYNRQTLEGIAASLPSDAALEVEELFARIERAESLIGRAKLGAGLRRPRTGR